MLAGKPEVTLGRLNGCGRCLLTSLEVRPVQVVKYTASMALHQVSTTGMNQALCRNCTRKGSFLIWYAQLGKT